MNIVQRNQLVGFLRQKGAPRQLRAMLGDYSEDDRNTFNAPAYDETDVFNGATGGTDTGFSIQAAMSSQPVGLPPMVQKNLNSFAVYPFAIGSADGSRTILPYNPKRTILIAQNNSTTDILYLNFSSDANLTSLQLAVGVAVILDYTCPNNSISVFFNNATPQSGIIIEGAPST